MKNCELCKSPARTYCESDDASLCWSCDTKVHGANFLVARHSRTLLCQLCQSVTPWQAAGAKLGNTVSFCLRCANGDTSNRDESGSEGEEDEDDEIEIEIEEDQEEEEGDNQVVPWSSSSASPPPPASDSEDCEDFVESDRRSLDLRFFPQDDITRRSSSSRQSAISCDDEDDSSRPMKLRRMEAVDEDVTSRKSGRPI